MRYASLIFQVPSPSSKVLILRGPPGCGKSATVRALAKEIGMTVQDWVNPTEVVAFEDVAVPRDGGGGWREGDRLAYVSQAKAFKDFLIRARRYGGVVQGERGARKIVRDSSILFF